MVMAVSRSKGPAIVLLVLSFKEDPWRFSIMFFNFRLQSCSQVTVSVANQLVQLSCFYNP